MAQQLRSPEYQRWLVARKVRPAAKAAKGRVQVSSYDTTFLDPDRGLLHVNLVVRQDVEQVAFSALNLILHIDLNPVLLPTRLNPDQGHLVAPRIFGEAACERNRVQDRGTILDFVHSRGLHFAEHRNLRAIDFLDDDIHARLRDVLRELLCDLPLEFERRLAVDHQFANQGQRDLSIRSDYNCW